MRRRLAAVLSADVVGYSTLTERDADSTLTALRRLRREVFGPAIAARRGRLVKSMGDGWLAVFDAATDAVEAAMQTQDRLVEEPLVRLRVGVHLGDVAEADEDVFGDAVNVSSRLQEMAEPGAVVISDAVYATLDGTLRPSFDDAGERALRGISRPIRLRVRGGEVAGASHGRRPDGFPRLAIVPVETGEARPELRELASALTGDLLSCLAGTQWLRARVRLDPRPGSYVLSSRLRALGDRIRYEAALDAPDGERLWSEKRDGSLSDGFDWQDETASAVATLAFRRILIHSARNLEAVPPHARSAEQWATLALIRGSADGESHRRALDCLWEAIGKAPDWGYAYALALAVAMGGQSLGHVEHIRPYLKHIDHWIERVEALEPEVSPSRIMLAFARLVRTKDPMEVRGALRSLLQGLPFEPDVLIWAGYCRLYIGEPEAALECFEKFQKGVVLDAYAPAVRAGAAGALLQMGRFAEALEAAEQALRINPLYPSPLRIAAAALAHLGRETEAQAMVARLLTVAPQESLSDLRARSGYCETPAVQLYFEGLARAGLPA